LNNQRWLLVPGYCAGFTNNFMSLQLAVVLAHLTSRVLVPFNFRIRGRHPSPSGSDPKRVPLALVPDLFDIPLPWVEEYLDHKPEPAWGATVCHWPNLINGVFVSSPDLLEDKPRLAAFRNGRPHLCTFAPEHEDAEALLIRGDTLGHYSHFFYLHETQRLEVIELMKRLTPKEPYRWLAWHIANDLGRYNAVHIRRTDFISLQFTPRAFKVSGEEICRNLLTRLDTQVPLVVCTDSPADDPIFLAIKREFKTVIFLEHLLEQDPRIVSSRHGLPGNDEGVVVLLTQLVASYAEVFVGTLYSTFTAMIHRLRGFDGRGEPFLYCYSDFDASVPFERCEFIESREGPFSWNRTRYPVSPMAYTWMREWPEAFR